MSDPKKKEEVSAHQHWTHSVGDSWNCLACVQFSLQCTLSSQGRCPLCSPNGAVAFYPLGHKGLDFIPVESSLPLAGGLEVYDL